VRAAIRAHGAVYFVAIGGAGALLSQYIESSQVVAYDDLGAEAVFRLRVSHFPVIVGDDMHGGDLFEIGIQRYRTAAVEGQAGPSTSF